MNIAQMNGIIPALITPFDEDHNVNYSALRQVVRYILDLGAAGFYVCGTSGEGFSCSIDERKKIVETVKDEVGNRAGVIVNISHMEFRVVLELAQHSQTCQVDAVSTLPPIYYPVTSDEVKRYYFSLLDQVSLPLTIYNIPMLSGRALDEAMVQRLAEHPKFVGIKHTSEDTELLERFKQVDGGRLMIWSARDAFYLSSLVMGADGAIGTTYNLTADVSSELTRAFRAGNLEQARAIQSAFNAIRSRIIKHGGYQSIKRCFTLMGIDAGSCRPPFGPVGSEIDDDLRKTLRTLDDLRRQLSLPPRAETVGEMA